MQMAPMLQQMQAPFRSQQPYVERATLLFQKATPRNLADARTLRESENGATLEIGDKQEVVMAVMDESYHGAQKLLKSDRAVMLLFLADPCDKDEVVEWAHQIQEDIDFTQGADYIAEVRSAIRRVNKNHARSPRASWTS